MRRRSRAGFTLVELLMTIMLMMVLAGIATMRYIDLKNEALSSSVAGDVQTIRLAVLNFYADSAAWPPTGPAGAPPAGLQQYLPPSFSFDRTQYQLAFETSSTAETDLPLVQVVISSDNIALMDKLAQRLSPTTGAYVYLAGTLYYIINMQGQSI